MALVADGKHEIVAWGAIDPADGGVGLYPSTLAAKFENRLAAFTVDEELILREPFDLSLPNGTTLHAAILFQRQDDGTIIVEQFTAGGRRWAVRLPLGAADALQLPTSISLGVKAFADEGGYGGHKYATAPAGDVWFVAVRPTLAHLVVTIEDVLA